MYTSLQQSFSPIPKLSVGRSLTAVVIDFTIQSSPVQIEKHVVHVLEQEAAREESEPSRLSPEELQYAKE